DEITKVVDDELTKLIGHITDDKKWEDVAEHCKNVGSSSDDTDGEKRAKQKACKLFALGLKHISKITDDTNNDSVPLRKTMMCAALNLYADQLINNATDQCPLDNEKLDQAIQHAFSKSKDIMGNGSPSCPSGTKDPNSCFVCKRENAFANCQIGSNATDKVGGKMTDLLKQNNDDTKMNKTLSEINKIETFCTQVQCAIKQELRRRSKLSNGESPSW
ncbi:SICAvar, type I (fragment), partial [Plasmodium knowlesi strain H]